MIKGNVSVNFYDGMDILFIVVCFYGYLYIVKILIEVGVVVNFNISNCILLIKVCYKGYFDVV